VFQVHSIPIHVGTPSTYRFFHVPLDGPHAADGFVSLEREREGKRIRHEKGKERQMGRKGI